MIINCVTATYLYHNASEHSQTCKLKYNDHPRDPKFVPVVDKWSLFRGSAVLKRLKWDFRMVVVVSKWSLFRSGRKLRFNCI
jgi:hypothetical protein